MGRLFRGLVRVFVLFVVATALFGIGSAVVAAVAKRRIVLTDDETSNEPTIAAVFAGMRFASRAPALRGGQIITWFAGHDVDLREATLDPAGAVMQLRTLYGGTQIAVPHGWRVRAHVLSIVGGTDVAIPDEDLLADAPVLELRGFTIFGGARVTTDPVASWSGADHEGEALPPFAVDLTALSEGLPPAMPDLAPSADDGRPA